MEVFSILQIFWKKQQQQQQQRPNYLGKIIVVANQLLYFDFDYYSRDQAN